MPFRQAALEQLLLLGEPSFGLAPLVVQELFAILAQINKAEGMRMRVVVSGTAKELRSNKAIRRSHLGY